MAMLLLAIQVMLIGALTSLPLATTSHDDSFWTVGPPVIAAVGTVAAFAVTFSLFLRGSKDREREQASKVYVLTRKAERNTVIATVHNASELPIWKVEAQPMRSGRIVSDHNFPTKPDIPPGCREEFPPWHGDPSSTPIERDWHLRFIDAAGRDWVRVGSKLARKRGSWLQLRTRLRGGQPL